MTLSWPTKDPDDVLDYQIDWTDLLDGDTIATSTWTVPSGITRDSDTFSGVLTTIWLSGGTDAQTYVLTNQVVTTGARTIDRSVSLTVKER